tara:strand:- start:385 stop:600 length:216 start_codon:yes stop_codon:yes gene_type:complete
MYGATGLRLAGAAMLLLLPVSLLAWSPSKVLEVYRAPFASQLCHSIETASKHAPEQDQEPPPADDEEPECD